MKTQRRVSAMFVPTLVMAAIAVILVVVAYRRGGAQYAIGLRAGLGMMIGILPLLLFAFVAAGMIQVLLPQEGLARWIGAESGMRGILLGTVAGGLTPGGPYVSLPIVAGLLRSGAGLGTVVAFLTAWSLWAVARLPMEVGILGWRFTAIRIATTFFFPPIAGIVAQTLFRGARVGQ